MGLFTRKPKTTVKGKRKESRRKFNRAIKEASREYRRNKLANNYTPPVKTQYI